MKTNFFLKFLLLLQLTSCITSNYNIGHNFSKKSGKIKLYSSKTEVKSILGTPNLLSNLDKETWYYIGQKLEHKTFFSPKIISQKVVKLNFKDDKLVKIHEFNDNDLRRISFSKDYSETKGDRENVMTELFRTAKSFNFLPR